MSGDTTMIETYDEDSPGGSYEDALRPRTMFPAPPIITLPDSCPSEVLHNVKLSFAVFWADRAAAANRLRVAVEYLLDDLAVPRTASKDGKTFDQSLNNRIEAFAKREPDHKPILHSLRVVGNLGSHGSIKLADILDGYELMEELLNELVSHRSAYLKGLTARILSKGSH